MKEFFGIDGYIRPAEGFLSWQHLLFVGILLSVMVILAVGLGKRNRFASPAQKNRVLIGAAILIDGLELFKIALLCYRDGSAEPILRTLPLFLCSIQLITIPLAAFSKGRVREASLDFVCIFGILGAVLGTIGAGQNYNAYPVLSFDNVVSGLTHTISGFASLYIMIAGLASMKKENIGITFGILLTFCIAGSHKTVGRIRTETLYMAFYHFLDGRLDNRCLFRTDQSVVTGMRVQRENGNAGIVDTEILFQRLMEDFQFLHDQFLGQVRSNFPYRNVTGYQCHAEIAFQQNHQGLVAFPYPFFNIFGCLPFPGTHRIY